jgi:long-chain fatty acid transport protein
MKNYPTKLVINSALAAATILTTSTVSAAGFALREQSAYGQGSSFAGVAAGGSISTSFWNPANTGEVEGSEFQGMISIIAAETDVNTTGASDVIYGSLNETGDISGTAAVPALYYAHEIDDKFSWGLSLTVPYGTSTEADQGSRSQYVSRNAEASSINLNPTFAYQITKNTSLGIGLMFQKLDLELSRAIPVGAAAGRFSANDPVLKIEGDGTALGATFGFTYKDDQNAFGIGYRSSLDHDIKGSLTVAALGVNAGANLDIKTPSSLTLGYKRQLTQKFNLGLTLERTQWSSVGTLPVRSSVTGNVLTIGGSAVAVPLNYQDTSYYSIGGEYKYSANTMLRAGIGLDETTVSDTTRTTQLPDNDRIWLSLGFTKNLKSGMVLDFGYTYVSLDEKAVVNIGPGHSSFAGLPYTGEADPTVHILSLGLSKKF